MDKNAQESRTRRRSALIAVLAALAFATTLVVRIPIPATTGYFNIGDVFVILAGLWLGPVAGLIVGAVGPTIADVIGYPQFVLATAITKGAEGLVAGVLAFSWRHKSARVVGAYVAAGVMCAGYFVFETVVYPALGAIVPFFGVTNLGAALAELPFNLVQGVIGASVALGVMRALPSGAAGSAGKVPG